MNFLNNRCIRYCFFSQPYHFFLHTVLNRLLDTVQFPSQLFSDVSPFGIRRLFLTPETLLEQELTENGNVSWLAVQDFDLLSERVREFLRTNLVSIPNDGHVVISASTIDHYKKTLDEQVLCDELVENGYPWLLVAEIAAMLRAEKHPSGIMELNSINLAEIISKIAWLTSDKRPWLIEYVLCSYEPDSFVLKATTNDVLRQRLAEIITMRCSHVVI